MAPLLLDPVVCMHASSAKPMTLTAMPARSLSADLPRSISDLNLAEHHIASLGVPATSVA